jgi:hypothetical protein
MSPYAILLIIVFGVLLLLELMRIRQALDAIAQLLAMRGRQ